MGKKRLSFIFSASRPIVEKSHPEGFSMQPATSTARPCTAEPSTQIVNLDAESLIESAPAGSIPCSTVLRGEPTEVYRPEAWRKTPPATSTALQLAEATATA